MNQPRHFIISANVINHPEISYLHWRLGAVQPFLPEQTPPEGFSPTDPISDWRTSNLPFIKHFNNSDYDWVEPEAPHRWLPVDTRTGIPSDVTLDYTPISTSTYDEFGSGWNDWRLSAQQHYSFFQNAEEGEQGLKNYKFGGWDMNYGRLSINFIAIWGRDVLASFPMPNDDEKHLTQTMSKRSGRRELGILRFRGLD